MAWVGRNEFLKQNPTILYVIIVLTVGAPLLGFFLSGPLGLAIGLLMGIAAFLLGPRAAWKVVETTRGGN